MSQGKVSEKSGNLDMDIKWQPCCAEVGSACRVVGLAYALWGLACAEVGPACPVMWSACKEFGQSA